MAKGNRFRPASFGIVVDAEVQSARAFGCTHQRQLTEERGEKMRPRMENCTDEEEKAIRCLAHGVVHARDAFGEQRLANILGTIAIDLSELTDTQSVPRASATSEEWLPTSV